VDGVEVTGDPSDIPLDAHTVVQLDVGTPVPFRPFASPPGPVTLGGRVVTASRCR